MTFWGFWDAVGAADVGVPVGAGLDGDLVGPTAMLASGEAAAVVGTVGENMKMLAAMSPVAVTAEVSRPKVILLEAASTFVTGFGGMGPVGRLL